MYNRRYEKRGFRSFIRRNGFYIGLCFCVAAVGSAAFFAITGTNGTPAPAPAPIVSYEPDVNVNKQNQPTLDQEKSAQPSLPAALPSASPSPTASPVTSTAPKPIMLKKPVNGDVIQAFSGDTLVFNSTLNMWLTHNGIDIAAGAGTDVIAALSGTVADIYIDESKGKVLVLEHASKQKTYYMGLADITVKKGDKVNAGAVVGKSGTPPFELEAGPHLHFEFTVNGVYNDPAKRIQ